MLISLVMFRAMKICSIHHFSQPVGGNGSVSVCRSYQLLIVMRKLDRCIFQRSLSPF